MRKIRIYWLYNITQATCLSQLSSIMVTTCTTIYTNFILFCIYMHIHTLEYIINHLHNTLPQLTACISTYVLYLYTTGKLNRLVYTSITWLVQLSKKQNHDIFHDLCLQKRHVFGISLATNVEFKTTIFINFTLFPFV